MKYFERFLAENESSFDLDISVHCDVEIFEWLMTYIHEPTVRPVLDKSIVVSILISSEFLQMDSLVEICLQDIATRLNDIIKLPIDLSCISDKLANRLASMTNPKILANTRDRKDKILNKLYKRRVEIDFSRKGGGSRAAASGTGAAGSAGPSTASNRAIAASLTCCRNCGMVYLDSFVAELTCRKAHTVVDYRGGPVRRHAAIVGWSLTTYLKSLHVTGMSWEAIYWHVWAACIVLRPPSSSHRHGGVKTAGSASGIAHNPCMISALEVDRYFLDSNEMHIYSRPKPAGKSIEDFKSDTSNEVAQKTVPFSLSCDFDNTTVIEVYKMYPRSEMAPLRGLGSLAAEFSSLGLATPVTTAGVTPTLSPHRSPEMLTDELFDLLRSQARFIEGGQHRRLLDTTAQTILAAASAASAMPSPAPSVVHGGIAASSGANRPSALIPPQPRAQGYASFAALLWGEADVRARQKAHSRLLRKCSPADAVPPAVTTDDILVGSLRSGSKDSKDVDRGRSRSGSRTRKQPKGSSAARPSSKGAGRGRRKRAPSVTSSGRVQRTDAASDAEAPADLAAVSADTDGADVTGDPDADADRDSDNSDLGVDQAARLGLAEGGGMRTRIRPDGSGSTTLRRACRRRAKSAVGSAVASGDLRDVSPPLLPAGVDRALSVIGEATRVPGTLSAESIKDLATLTALSPDAEKLAERGRGSVRGVWLTEHPLQVQPMSFLEAVQKVGESGSRTSAQGPPAEKQLLWQLDLLRQHDEQCMDRFEVFLASRRNPGAEEQIKLRAKAAAACPYATFSASLVAQQQHLLHLQQQHHHPQGNTRTSTGRRKDMAGAVNIANFEYYKDRGRAPVR